MVPIAFGKCSYPSQVDCDSSAEVNAIEKEWQDGKCTRDQMMQCIAAWVATDTAPEISIRTAKLTEDTLSCDRETILSVRIDNIGSVNLEEVVLQVSSNELGIDKRFIGLELDAGDYYYRNIPLSIAPSQREGYYEIDIATYVDFDSFEDRMTFSPA